MGRLLRLLATLPPYSGQTGAPFGVAAGGYFFGRRATEVAFPVRGLGSDDDCLRQWVHLDQRAGDALPPNASDGGAGARHLH